MIANGVLFVSSLLLTEVGTLISRSSGLEGDYVSARDADQGKTLSPPFHSDIITRTRSAWNKQRANQRCCRLPWFWFLVSVTGEGYGIGGVGHKCRCVLAEIYRAGGSCDHGRVCLPHVANTRVDVVFSAFWVNISGRYPLDWSGRGLNRIELRDRWP